MLKGAQALIYSLDKQKVLLMKREDIPFWTLPGGRKDKNEPLKKTVVREVLEEIGVKVKIEKFIGQYKVWYFPWAGITTVYRCKIISGVPKPSIEAVEVRFWHLNKLPVNLFPYLFIRIKDGLSNS